MMGMITDNQRREVAARLRALDVHEWYDSADEIDSLETAIGCSIGQDWQDQDWWERIADLIDRPTTTVTVASGDDDSDLCIKCNSCCRGWHISKYDKSFTYCPECGAEVVE